MKRPHTFTETGEFKSIYVPPEHKSRKDPGATAESLSPLVVEPVPPTWRDFWAILRGRYQSKLRVRTQANVAAMDFILHDVWSSDTIEAQLHEPSYFLGWLDEAEKQ